MNPDYKPIKKPRKISRKGLVKKLDDICAKIIRYGTTIDARCAVSMLPEVTLIAPMSCLNQWVIMLDGF